jgi:hypothetical protein
MASADAGPGAFRPLCSMSWDIILSNSSCDQATSPEAPPMWIGRPNITLNRWLARLLVCGSCGAP